MLRSVYYARVSTDEEKQIDALKKQTQELEDFINKQKDWYLVDSYVDEGKSGTSRKGRNEYNRLFDDITKNKYDLIVIKDQSRLMRNVLDWYTFLDATVKNNIKLYLFLERSFYSPENSFLTGIKAMMAEEYSRELSKKIKSASLRSQNNKIAYGNSKIWGYKKDKGKLIIDDKEADIVKLIFKLYIEGQGFRTISHTLELMGIKSLNNTNFSISTLKRMIRNEKYKGTLVSGKQRFNFETKKTERIPQEEWIRFENVVPIIINKETWDTANEILSRKNTKVINKEQKTQIYGYFQGNQNLSKKLVCGKCGQPFWHVAYKIKNKTEIMDCWQCGSYKSFGKNHPSGCNSKTIHTKKINALLKTILFNILSREEINIDEIINSIVISLQKNITTQSSSSTIVSLKKKINILNSKSEKLLNGFLDGTILKENYITKRDSITNEITQANQQLKDYESTCKKLKTKSELLEKYKNLLSVEVSEPENISDSLIKSIINKITVYDNLLIIEISTENTEKQISQGIDTITLFETHLKVQLNEAFKNRDDEYDIKVIVNM